MKNMSRWILYFIASILFCMLLTVIALLVTLPGCKDKDLSENTIRKFVGLLEKVQIIKHQDLLGAENSMEQSNIKNETSKIDIEEKEEEEALLCLRNFSTNGKRDCQKDGQLYKCMERAMDASFDKCYSNCFESNMNNISDNIFEKDTCLRIKCSLNCFKKKKVPFSCGLYEKGLKEVHEAVQQEIFKSNRMAKMMGFTVNEKCEINRPVQKLHNCLENFLNQTTKEHIARRNYNEYLVDKCVRVASSEQFDKCIEDDFSANRVSCTSLCAHEKSPIDGQDYFDDCLQKKCLLKCLTDANLAFTCGYYEEHLREIEGKFKWWTEKWSKQNEGKELLDTCQVLHKNDQSSVCINLFTDIMDGKYDETIEGSEIDGYFKEKSEKELKRMCKAYEEQHNCFKNFTLEEARLKSVFGDIYPRLDDCHLVIEDKRIRICINEAHNITSYVCPLQNCTKPADGKKYFSTCWEKKCILECAKHNDIGCPSYSSTGREQYLAYLENDWKVWFDYSSQWMLNVFNVTVEESCELKNVPKISMFEDD